MPRHFPHPAVKTSPFNAERAQVQSLVEELRFHIPPGQKNQNTKQKQHCNKFNKDWSTPVNKNGPHQKIILKKIMG